MLLFVVVHIIFLNVEHLKDFDVNILNNGKEQFTLRSLYFK